MRHTTWLQNQTPAKALDRKTPYEMLNKSKPYLGGIQEFGMAAYVKDSKAGKLDMRVQQGRFVGYDSESKGYRIYWPTKRSISVERDVVFNENNILERDNTTVTVGVQSEEEKDKVIQHPENTKEVKNHQTDNEPQNKDEDETQSKQIEPSTPTKTINLVVFPSSLEPEIEAESDDEEIQQYGRGHHT